MAALANSDFLEQMGDNDNNDSSSERVNPDKAVVGQGIEVSTPLKGEKSLKRHSTDIVDMDIDITTKKPRVSTQGKEVVDLEEDDEESINKRKGTTVEEEHNDQS